MNSNRYSVRFLSISAVMAALVCITTMLIQIPIPLGYANLGNAVIFLTVFLFGRRSGMWAGSIGSALADILTGYAYWAIPTFFIKALVAWIAGTICFRNGKADKLFCVRAFAGCVLAVVLAAIGYTVTGMVLYGSVAAGLASAPGLLMEGVLHIAAFYGVASVLEKANLRPLLQLERKELS